MKSGKLVDFFKKKKKIGVAADGTLNSSKKAEQFSTS